MNTQHGQSQRHCRYLSIPQKVLIFLKKAGLWQDISYLVGTCGHFSGLTRVGAGWGKGKLPDCAIVWCVALLAPILITYHICRYCSKPVFPTKRKEQKISMVEVLCDQVTIQDLHISNNNQDMTVSTAYGISCFIMFYHVLSDFLSVTRLQVRLDMSGIPLDVSFLALQSAGIAGHATCDQATRRTY